MTPEEIKQLRERLKLTQMELAYLLDTTPTSVSGWELGRNKPSKIYVREMKKL